MPNRRAHRQISAAASTAYVFLQSHLDNNEPVETVLKCLGACFSGMAVASLPDIIDPPTSPRHRQLGHSCTLNVIFFSKIHDKIKAWSCYFSDLAREYNTSNDPFSKLFAIACQIIAGFLLGLIPGYVSHIVADAITPGGLPI